MAGRPRLTDENFDASKMGENPFTRTLNISVSETVSRQKLIGVDMDEEVVVGTNGKYLLENTYLSEVQHFTKVFHSPEHRKEIGKLPDRAKSLLIWIILELKASKDYIIFNIPRYKSENRCSHNTYLRAVQDLANASIILPTVWQNVFWINPSLLFNGSRIKKYESNVNVFRRKGDLTKSNKIEKQLV